MVQHSDIDHTGITGTGGSVATDAIFDAKGDLAVGTGANTAAKRTVGTNGQVLTADSGETTGVKWATPASSAFNPGSTMQKVVRTAGNLSLAANTTTHTEVSSALRLTLAAAAGDVLMIGISSMITQGGSGEASIDSATIVAGAIVNQVSPGTNAIGHGYTTAALRSIGATLVYVVQSGDISGGNVVVSPTFRNTDGASAGTLRAASDYALLYWAMNMKQ